MSQVVELMDRVGEAFIKHFVNGDRDRGMNTLRPKMKKEEYAISFIAGVSFGGTTALLIALILIIRALNVVESPNKDQYMDNMFPLYRFNYFSAIELHLFNNNRYFPALEKLDIDSCPLFLCFSNVKTLSSWLQYLPYLQTSKLSNCEEMGSLPEWMGNLTSLESIPDCLQRLHQLTIFNCSPGPGDLISAK